MVFKNGKTKKINFIYIYKRNMINLKGGKLIKKTRKKSVTKTRRNRRHSRRASGAMSKRRRRKVRKVRKVRKTKGSKKRTLRKGGSSNQSHVAANAAYDLFGLVGRGAERYAKRPQLRRREEAETKLKEAACKGINTGTLSTQSFEKLINDVIDTGGNIDTKRVDSYLGITPLLCAVKKQRAEHVRTLLKHGARINIPQKKPDGTRHLTIMEEAYRIAEHLDDLDTRAARVHRRAPPSSTTTSHLIAEMLEEKAMERLRDILRTKMLAFGNLHQEKKGVPLHADILTEIGTHVVRTATKEDALAHPDI
jgi:hypothetical protein